MVSVYTTSQLGQGKGERERKGGRWGRGGKRNVTLFDSILFSLCHVTSRNNAIKT